MIFDRGPSSLRRCAYLENYLGFPGGIDVDTFHGLIHDHAETAGCTLVSATVDAVAREPDGRGAELARDDEPTGDDPSNACDGPAFVLETSGGRRVVAARVIAATRYGGEYLGPLDDGSIYRTVEHHGEVDEHVDPEFADADGRTPVDGLYVASPSAGRDLQAIVAAGRGAHVGRTVVEDVRRDRGYPDPVVGYWDWLRPAAELAPGERRDHWREWFDEHVPDDCTGDEERLRELREADVDRLAGDYRDSAAVADLTDRGVDRLLDRIGEERVRASLERIGSDAADDTR